MQKWNIIQKKDGKANEGKMLIGNDVVASGCYAKSKNARVHHELQMNAERHCNNFRKVGGYRTMEQMSPA